MAADPALKAEVDALAVAIAASASASSAGDAAWRGRTQAVLGQAQVVEGEIVRLRTKVAEMLAAADDAEPAPEQASFDLVDWTTTRN